MEFSYSVRAQDGSIIDGSIEALSESAAIDILHSKGYTVLSLVSTQRGVFSYDILQTFSRPKTKDIVIFTRQLATLIDADMPLAEGLRTLSKQVEKPLLQKIIGDIADAVEGGSSLSGALSEYPKLFSTFYIKLVKSGELSGKLHDSLSYLADYLERSQAINSKLRGALTYPAFVFFAMVVVGFIVLTFMLPKMLMIFEEAGLEELPLATKALIWISGFFSENVWYILIAGILLIGSSFWYFSTANGKLTLDEIKLKIPIFKEIIKSLYLARMGESLATLIKAGIPILDAIKITADLVGNHVYQTALLDAEEHVRGGGNMSDIFAQYPQQISPLMTSMIAIGERTGKIEGMLNHVSRFYRTESENYIQNLSQLIEPILILVLGAGVALMIISVLMPMYSMVGAG